MQDDRQSRHERLHEQVADQAVTTQRLRLESKELRAAASTILDEARAVRLAARGLLREPTPPVPTHPPAE